MLILNKLSLCKLVLLILLFGGCNQDEQGQNSFIFGRYFGECIGDCGTFYKLTDQSLLPDNEAYFNSQKINFSNQPLSETKENLVRNLFKEFPKSLYDIKEHIIGCPDCADQGGYYLEVMENGVKHYWNIDRWAPEIDEELKSYLDKIDQTLIELKK
jgi:hypothetical protein